MRTFLPLGGEARLFWFHEVCRQEDCCFGFMRFAGRRIAMREAYVVNGSFLGGRRLVVEVAAYEWWS